MIMKIQKYLWRWSLAFVFILAVAGLFIWGIERLRFDADILSSLPQNDPVLADARYIITHHPIYDRVVIDLEHADARMEILEEGTKLVEARMRESGLFKTVGFEQIGQVIPELMHHVIDHLPVLFNAAELEKSLVPLLVPAKIHEILRSQFSSLQELGGIGQSGFMAEDPLALRNLVLSRLSSLAPSQGARIQNGRLVSADGKHILIIAEPAVSGMDTRYAMRIAALVTAISEELHTRYGNVGGLALTPVGAYRAALDNETSAKRNIRKAVLFSTIAIVLLLLVGFPRPLIGLLSLLPAFAGTMMAIFVYSLFHPSISLLAIGFGGAIISFTVDYGIAYLLFLDRPHETRGLEATKEVWSLGLLAMMTTAVSFAFLSWSGFPALMEIGQFAALGVIFTYIFVHAVFPLVFPVVPPAKRPSRLPLQRFVNSIASAEGMWKVYAALTFGIFMLFFAKPDFRMDLHAMNAVSAETLEAEKRIRHVWGDILSKVYVMVEGKDKAEFQRKCDELTGLLNREVAAGRISQFFVSSLVFPGETLAGRNGAAWKNFWTTERIAGLKKSLADEAQPLGFAAGAFVPFLERLGRQHLSGTSIPERYTSALGIQVRQNPQLWMQVVPLTPGPAYDADDFYRRFSASGLVKVFDPTLFTNRLGALLQAAFMKMALIVGLITILTAFFYFLDWRLTILGMAPTLFAIICTLGTLNLLGQPLGIPTLMVSVVVIGMGTDYALYLIRAYQRYFDDNNPFLGLIRLSVFLSFATTFLGFGVLALSDNALLKSAGMGLALGIGYSFLGAVMITPPLLKHVFAPVPFAAETVAPGSKMHFRRAVGRYRHMESYPRLFARFKILMDPMFPRLAAFVGDPKVIVDVGTGYGVPAAWLLVLYPMARVYGIEPDRKRVHIASRAIGDRGSVVAGAAPDLPVVPGKADTAIILDMIHMLTDGDLRLTLRRLHEKLQPGGTLVLRTTIPSGGPVPWKRWLETTRISAEHGSAYFRSTADILVILSEAGFEVTHTENSAPRQEEHWFIARTRQRIPEEAA